MPIPVDDDSSTLRREARDETPSTVPVEAPAPGQQPPAQAEDDRVIVVAPPTAQAPLPMVDPRHYEVGAEFSHGGTGRLLSARDRRLGRTVAIKQLRFRAPHIEARFRREAEITARLEHPAIVPVHEAGRWPGGEPFYAMKLVSGRTLREVIASTRGLDERMALIPNVLAVVEAMAYAHSKGIIHRDLKPSNVLVGAFGETVLIDWGLAKDLSRPASEDDSGPETQSPERAELTRVGAVLGTPAYMPPEQALARPVDERADVYSLGAMLYHVLSGSAPYRADDSDEVLRKVLSSPPRPLEAQERGVPEDLAAVVRRAMARDPAERYPNAGELAADLRRFLTGRLVQAHRYSRWVLLKRWARGNRRPVAVASVALLALALVATIAVLRVTSERRAALTAQAVAETRRNQLLLAQARSSADRDPTLAFAWARAYAATSDADVSTVRALVSELQARGLARHAHRGYKTVNVSGDGYTLVAMHGGAVVAIDSASGVVRVVDARPGKVRHLAPSSDGQLVAGVGDEALTVWEVGTGHKRLVLPLEEPHSRGYFTPDGKRLIVGTVRGPLTLIELATGATRKLLGHTGALRVGAYSPDGRWFVSNSFDGTDRLWRLEGDFRGRLVPHAVTNGGATMPDISSDNELIAWGKEDGTVRVADMATLTTRALPGHNGMINRVAFSPDGRSIASAGVDRSVRVFDLASGTSKLLEGHTNVASRVAWSPDGRLVASAGMDRLVILWDLPSGDHVTLRGLDAQCMVLRFTSDGRHLVTGDADGQVRVWAVAPSGVRVLHLPATQGVALGAEGTLLSLGTDGGHSIDLRAGHPPVDRKLVPPVTPFGVFGASADGRQIAGAGIDRSIWVLDVQSNTARTLGRHDGSVADVVFSPDGKTLATAAADRRVKLWDLTSGVERVLEGHEAGVWHLAFSPDGRSLASGGDDSVVRVWDVASGSGRALPGHEQRVADLDFHAADLLVSAAGDGMVRVWDPSTGKGRVLAGHGGWVTSARASPDGRQIVSASEDRTARLWNLATGESRVLPHPASVRVVRYTHDGKRVITGATDGVVRIWSTVDGGAEASLPGHGDSLLTLVVAADDRSFATTAEDETIRLWPLAPVAARLPLSAFSSVELGPDDRPITPGR